MVFHGMKQVPHVLLPSISSISGSDGRVEPTYRHQLQVLGAAPLAEHGDTTFPSIRLFSRHTSPHPRRGESAFCPGTIPR